MAISIRHSNVTSGSTELNKDQDKFAENAEITNWRVNPKIKFGPHVGIDFVVLLRKCNYF